MTEDREAFLERWSRRKLERPEEKPAPPPSLAEAGARKDEPVVALPPVESLNPESDFVPFMDPKVDGETRRAALKKLFADARFNVPDPFEAYSGDYTVSETIPLEMLKALNHARKLLFDETEKLAQAPTGKLETTPAEAADVAGKQDL